MCVTTINESTLPTNPNTTSKSRKAATSYRWSEIKKHNTPTDSWVVYKPDPKSPLMKVYDVSNWTSHPGGAVIFTHGGEDMTDIFKAFHAVGSEKVMSRFYIGVVDQTVLPVVSDDEAGAAAAADSEATDAADIDAYAYKLDETQIKFEQGYRELRIKLETLGYFKSNPLFYIYKSLSTLAIWVFACALNYFSTNTYGNVVSALILGLFYQQSGWLAHDFLHHQVFPHRKHGDLAGVFWGNLMQGFSVTWWKNKHNGHHATPNLHNSSPESQDGDPDIDTMPLLAWSLFQAKAHVDASVEVGEQPSELLKFFIKYQEYTYFPILLLARLSWLNESFKTAFQVGKASSKNAELELKSKGLQHPILEKACLLLHYVWVIIVSSGFFQFSLQKSIAYFLISTMSCGFMLALVFGLGHNGMAVYSAESRPDFWKLQVTTTRNIIGGHGIPQFFVNWFCGGLQYQVEHHLFPLMPRHHLPKTNILVKAFCKEWGVTTHETDMWDGSIEVLRHLGEVSKEFVEEFPAM